MALTDDRSVLFTDFAVEGTYDGTTTVNGIFDSEYAEVFQGERVGISSARPVFMYNADDLDDPTTGVEMVVGSDVYTVRDIEIDRDIGKLILESTGTVITPPTLTGVFSSDFSADFD